MAMDMPPATQGRRASTVVDRKLDELCDCLDGALSSRQRSPYTEERLRTEIKAKTDFLRSLLAAEAECHGGAGARPEHLAEAEARFAVLEATFHRWERRDAVAAPELVEEEVVVEADCSGSSCSCTDSCQEAMEADATVEAGSKEGTSDVIAECEAAGTRGEAAAARSASKKRAEAIETRDEVTLDAIAKRRDADREAAVETRGRTVRRRWWRHSAAWCGAAGVVAVVAVGLAVELATVAHHNVNVYVVPT